MKKILFIAVCCLCLCGCGKPFNDYQFSELSYEKMEGTSKAYIINGSIKNISNNICENKDLSVKIELKSGSIKDTTYIYISNPSIGKIKSFEDIIFTDLTNFQIKVKEVYC